MALIHNKLFLLLEGPSDEAALDSLLPRLLPENFSHQCIPHDGKTELKKSIVNKLKNWNTPNTWFVILVDKDSADCINLKQALTTLCKKAGRPQTLVRIAVHELESWFLGDLAAVGRAFNLPKLGDKQKSKFHNPDAHPDPVKALEKLTKKKKDGSYQKISGAKAIAPHLSLTSNTSNSFQHFISGLKKYIDAIQQGVIN